MSAQEDIGARLGVDQSLVARIGLGERMPTPAQKRLFFSEFAIPIEAWDRPPNHPPEPDWTKIPTLSDLTFDQQTQRLFEEIEVMRFRARWYNEHGDVKLYSRMMREANTMHLLLGRLTGATLEITEERAARLPAVRRMLERLALGLRAYPDAFAEARRIIRSVLGEVAQ
jgi:hypothetical protein